MSLPGSIPAKIPGESPSASPPASLFDSFSFRGQRMKTTRRFKRVVKPTLPIPDDVGTSQRSSKKTRLRAKPKPKLQSQPRLDAKPPKMEILPPHFFQIDALDLAPRLLGKFLRRDDVVLQITEVTFHSPFTSPLDCG